VVGDLFDDAPDPLIGRRLEGRYEVLARLGEGGAGVVYRGRQAQLGRLVAIKVLQEERAAVVEWRRRFAREARALSALAHPNIVPVADSGIDRGVPFLVMELLDGKTLKDLIEEGPLPLWRALDIARQVLRGLAFAHGKGIVHRDLKPANVFLQALPDEDDHVRLLDFGMVKFLEGSSSRTMAELTHAGARWGTPAYMSPEQVKGVAVDARTDVYAAGVLLFELLAGRRPFVADSREGYMGAHLSEAVPSLAKLRPTLAHARSFQAVIARAMAKRPADRFNDADAMLAELEDVIARLPPAALKSGRPEARRKSAPHQSIAAPSSGSHFWLGVITVFALAAGVAAVKAHLQREEARPVRTAPPRAQPLPTPAHAAQAPTALPPSAPPSQPSPTPPPTSAPAEPKAPAGDRELAQQPEIEAKATRDARDPWGEPVPRALRSIRDRVSRGTRLSQRALAPVYEFAHQNPGDPRPWLLLGHAYAQLDWLSDSVDRYLRAFHVDSTCRGDPQMLTDLLKAAAHPVAGRSAARAIRDIYGAEAIPALERDLQGRADDSDATARLARLRESLSAPM
jgi:serine/threonine-protein kinase